MMTKLENPFEELDAAQNECCQDDSNDAETKRERAKYYVVEIRHVATNQRELREFLEANDDLAGSCRLVKGNEIFAKRKTVYTF
jgi:hypothetical protein